MNKYNYVVFFDIENDLLNFNSKHSFLEYFLTETLPAEGYAKKCFEKFIEKCKQKSLSGANESVLNKKYFRNFSGMPIKLLSEIGYSWYYKNKMELKKNFFQQKTLCEIEMHKRNNAQVVILSTSFLPCLEPLIEDLSIDSTICAQLEVLNGYYTGNILSDPLNSLGKTRAIKNFLNEKNQERCLDEYIISEQDGAFCDISYEYKEEIMKSSASEKFRNMYRN